MPRSTCNKDAGDRFKLLPVAYVTLQFCLSAGLVLTVQIESLNLITLGITGGGVLLSVWSIAVMRLRRLSVMPDVRTDSQLVTAGPYHRVRHPMYSGLALFTFGCCLAPWSWPKLLVWLVLVLVLNQKAQWEEASLQDAFPEYTDYQKRTRRFIPFLY